MLPRPWSNVKVPHLACKVWVRSSYSLVVCLERDLWLSYTLHTLTFSMRTNSVLTPCKARCGTFTLLQFQFLIPNFQPVSPFPKVRKQEFVLIARCLVRSSFSLLGNVPHVARGRVAKRHSGVRPHWRITPNKILLLYIRYIKCKAFFRFCFISGHRIFVTTPHYFDLPSFETNL